MKFRISDLSIKTLITYLGHFAFAFILLTALVFYKERALYTDSAFQFFKMINSEDFNLEAGRYAAYIPELPIILALKMHLPLKVVMIVFSLSYMLFFYGMFILITHGLKKAEVGIVIVFFYLVCIKHSFFHTVTETYLGLAWAALLYALLTHEGFGKSTAKVVLHYLAIALVLVMCYWSHPVTVFPVLFILAWVGVEKKKLLDYRLISFFLIVIGLYVFRTLTTDTNSYEGGFYENLKSNFVGNFLNSYCLKYLAARFELYFTLVVLFVACLWSLFRNQKYLLLFLFIGYHVAFFVITVVSYFAGDADIMMERSFLPFTLVIGIMFMKEVVVSNARKMILLIPVVIFIWGGFQVVRISTFYKSRTLYLNHLIHESDELSLSKVVLNKQSLDPARVEATWAFSMETLMLSSMLNKEKPVTIYLAEIDKIEFDKNNTDLFLAVDFWRDWKSSELNPHYFRLPSNPYTIKASLE